MRIPHVMTSFGLAASALVGFSVVSQSGGTAESAIEVLELDVRAADGVPADATAAVLNITAARAQSPGFAVAWPCDESPPETSILNYRPGAAVSNSTVVSLSDTGTVCISRSSVVDLIVDVNSAFRAGGAFNDQNPERLLDSRNANPVQAGQEVRIPIAGQGSVPAGASAAVINIAAARASGAGFITAWPCGGTKPQTAALNFRPGPAVSNTTIVALAGNGDVCLESSVATDIVVDVNGSFTTAGSTPFLPQRLLDTRRSNRVAAGSMVEVDVTVPTGLPESADAAVLNIAAARPSGIGFVTAWPCGSPQPGTSTLNYSDQPVSNSTIVGLGTDGKVCMTSSNAVDLVVDVNGGFSDETGIVSFTPTRIIDTRTSTTGPNAGGGGPVRSGVFVETFDGNQGLERFDRGVWHRDDSVVATTSWTGDHDENCGTPASQRVIQRSRPQDSFYTCRDHLMTSVGDTSGYSIAWFSPNEIFNGQTTVSVDVNSTNLGQRQWWEVSMVPANFNSGVPGCELCIAGASAISDFFPVQPSNTFVFGLQAGGQRVMVDYENAPRSTSKLCNDANPIDPEGCNSKPIRRTWTATDNRNGTVTIQILDETITMPGSFPDGEWRLVIKDHNYTPNKSETPVGHTWHWDNIIVN